jgi:hypothetical protein
MGMMTSLMAAATYELSMPVATVIMPVTILVMPIAADLKRNRV